MDRAPPDVAVARATGNSSTAAALLLIISVTTIVASRTPSSSPMSPRPPKGSMSVSASVSASPLSSIAWPSPKLAAMTTITSRSTESRASVGVSTRRATTAKAARKAAGRMSRTPVPASTSSPTITRPTTGAFSSRSGAVAVERRDHEEVAPVEGARPERRPGEHQEDVARPQAHLAELALHPLVGPVDGDDGAAVAAAEAASLQGAAHQARPGRDHGLVEAALDRRSDRAEVALLHRDEPRASAAGRGSW